MIPSNLWQTIEWIETGYCLPLTRALLHFLWQGCVVAILYALVVRALRRAPANARYIAGVAALLLMAACLPVTLWLLPAPAIPQSAVDAVGPSSATATRTTTPMMEQPIAGVVVGESVSGASPLIASAANRTLPLPMAIPHNMTIWQSVLNRVTLFLTRLVARASPYASGLYLCGVGLMLLRVSCGLCGGRRLRQTCAPLTDGAIFAMVHEHARRLGMRMVPVVAYAGRISVPIVVGVLRPMILLPASLASGLTFPQTEAILLHELAHIHRFDLLVNILQRLVEALLFFHPAVWWVSHRVDAERENACDDLVLRSHCGRTQYADALVRMAELCMAAGNRGGFDRAALAATGGTPSQFKRRVLRLLGIDEQPRFRLTTFGMLGLVLLTTFVMLAPVAWQATYSAAVETKAEAGAHADAKPANATASPDQRTLHFPSDRALGVVYWRSAGVKPYKSTQYDGDWKKAADAQGEVRIPADADVRLDISKAASSDLSGLDDLRPDDVQAISLRSTAVNDEQLAHVGRLTGLRVLDLQSSRVGDAGIQRLVNLRKLQEIDLDAFSVEREGFGVGDEAMKVLGQLPELEAVHLRLTKVTDAGLAALAQAKSLTLLGLAGTQVTDAGLVYLKQLPGLEHLALGVYNEGARISDDGLKTIGELLHLKSLDLSGTRITDAGLPYLKNLVHLESLSLDHTRITNAGLAHLAPLTALRDLRLYTRDETDDVGVEHIAKLKSLRRLTTHLTVTAKGVATLATMPHLETLDLSGDHITDDAVRPIAQMKSLKQVSFQNCPMTDEGLAALAGLKDLEWVSLFDTRVKGEGIKYLHDLPNLSLLDITFDYLHKPSPGQRPTLREVCKFSHLKRLSIRGKGIVDDDLACLVGMNIEHLELGFPVGDRGAEYISKIASLKMLDCRSLMSEDNWIISDVGLERLSHLSHLEHMQITGTFTDKGMEHLARLKSLEYLYLGSPNVTADGLTALASKLPCLQEARRQGEAIPIPDFVTSKKDSIRRHKGQLRVDEDELEDHAPPAWQLTAWVNATPKQFSPENLRGKVVLVDFWFTACKPCRAMMPRLKELHNKYQAQGLVVLGIHMSDGAQKMPEYVAKEQIPWPTAADVDNATVKAWEVDGYPGIYLIDRSGKLRVAGVYQDDLEKAVAKLLEEKTPPAVAPGDNQGSSKVLDVRILGNQSVPLDKIRRNIHTRPNRPFDPEMIKEDVRRLENARLFVDVKTYFQQVNGGRIVFFEVLERPLLKEVLFVGCAEVHKKVLQKEAHIKEGDAADPLVIEEARGKLEDFYQKKGFTKAKVTLLEGDKPQDRRAVFLINEDVKQKVWDVKFVGNTIASDDRLKTQIKSKSSFPNTFGNEIDHKSQERLTAYYRGLGFFHARISEPVFDYNEKNDLVTITFVIDEGVRFTIRNVSIIGNTKFTAAELLSELKLKSSEYFNQEQMAADIRILQDKYGSSGYVFADVKADPQFLETTGQPNPLHDRYGLSGSVEPIVLVRGYLCQLDLIYQIKEGHRCRVGKIDVTVKGEYPHAQMTTILNQLSFKHGDVIDIRKIRDCETRIRASGLFENRPDGASRPKIVFSPSVQDGREPGDQTVDVTVDCGRYIGPATP